AHWLTITLIEDYQGFLLAILPPGAFFGLGLLIAVKNRLDRKKSAASSVISVEPVPLEGATADR
ncbi:MAG: electron transport complex subunit RsxE, partial [Thiohalomonadales bacterium]